MLNVGQVIHGVPQGGSQHHSAVKVLIYVWVTVGLLVITITVNTYIIFIDVLSRTVCSR